MDTLEVQIDVSPREPWNEVLIAELSELGFESFVETKTGIMAYGPVTLDINQLIKETSLENFPEVEVNIKTQIIPHQNWNAQWEENFDPVHVLDYVSILAPFHSTEGVNNMKVIIQPQMSFGTGHHQTTWLMSKILFEIGEMPKQVLDMGTGTGVLAVIAEKLGAERILGIDIEEWSAENAKENVKLNDCSKIEIVCGDIDLLQTEHFGLIIANINKNVLKSHMKEYANHLTNNGILLLSGFFSSDVHELAEFASQFGLFTQNVETKDEWALMQLIKTN